MRDTLDEFEERGLVEDDLERLKMAIVSQKIYGMESVFGKVAQLAANETYRGSPDFSAADIARYEAVTEEDLMRVYKKYIKDKPAVILSVVPNGQLDMIAAQDTWTRPGERDSGVRCDHRR